MPLTYYEIRPYTLKELAALFHVDKKTFLVWIHPYADEIGEREGRIYRIAQVEIIARRIGWPYYYTKRLKVVSMRQNTTGKPGTNFIKTNAHN